MRIAHCERTIMLYATCTQQEVVRPVMCLHFTRRHTRKSLYFAAHG